MSAPTLDGERAGARNAERISECPPVYVRGRPGLVAAADGGHQRMRAAGLDVST
jgi:hypothetical protein